MDWMEKQCCLRCNKGGKLLVCNENGCPIVVHKKCLVCEVQIDEFGKFYCPYCIFKRVTEEMHQLRDKAMLARENLLKFIEEEMGDCTKTRKPKPLMSEKNDPISSAVVGNENFHESENNLKSDDCWNHRVPKEHHQEERHPTHTSSPSPCDETDDLIKEKQNEGGHKRCRQNSDINECGNNMMMVVYQSPLNPFSANDDGDRLQCEETTHQTETVQFTTIVKAEPLTKVDQCQYENVNKNHELGQNSSLMHGPVLSRRKNKYLKVVKEKQNITEVDCMQEQVQKNTESLAPEMHLQSKVNKGIDILTEPSRRLKRKNPPESEVQIVNSTRRSKGVSYEERDSKQLKQPSYQSTTLTYLNGKRGKMFWTAEEEDMLKEGVAKFSMMVNKNIPWRKILDFGCHVFNPTRTPADLKDKWRNILAKES